MRSFFRQASLAVPLVLTSIAFSQAARADCQFNTPAGGEPTLQASLGELLQSAPNTVTGCLNDGIGTSSDANWTSVGQTSATLLLEIAGFSDINSFGIYDASDPSNQLLVFSGPANRGSRAQITFAPDGTVSIVGDGYYNEAHFDSTAFGFYLLTGEGHTMHSDSSLNVGGADRMYGYRGNGTRFISGPIVNDGDPGNDVFGATDAILAYEDLLNGDNDFQDFVVLVRGVQPVPLPAAAWLFGGALLALRTAASRRRKSTPL
jgi:hypothetical protein